MDHGFISFDAESPDSFGVSVQNFTSFCSVTYSEISQGLCRNKLLAKIEESKRYVVF